MSLTTLRPAFARRVCNIFAKRNDSSITFNGSQDEVADIIERNLDKNTKSVDENGQPRLLTTRREALSLYREIVRITALFEWPNDQGRPWRDVLRESARQEFESARHERDPEMVNRLLIVGRDAVHQVAERFVQMRETILNTPPPKTSPPP